MYLNQYYPTTKLRINVVGRATEVKILQQLWICSFTGQQEWRDIPQVFNAPYKEESEVGVDEEIKDAVDL